MTFALPTFRTMVRRKETPMLTALALVAAFAAWRLGRAALDSLRQLPKRNEDMVLY